LNPRTKRRLILTSAVVGSLATIVAGGLLGRSWYRASQVADKRREGLALFADGKFSSALEPLSFAARNNDDFEVVLALAECRLGLPEANGKHLVTAAGYFRAVQARDQSNVRAMRGLLEAYIGLGHLPEIPPLVQRLLAAAPTDLRAREVELEVLNLTGKFTEAAAHARELQRLDPTNGRWRAAELMSLERAGADAEGRIARVREWQKDQTIATDPSLHLLEADLLRELGQSEQSRGVLRALVASGVPDRVQLETLIGALESANFEVAERDQLIERAIAASRGALARPSDASDIEGQRLLRAGRLSELGERFASASASDPAAFRLRFSALYLAGKVTEAAAFAKEHAPSIVESDSFVVAALAVSSTEPAHVRIEAIAGPHRACPKDPVIAIMLSDIMLSTGDFDEAQSILVNAFESSGESFQPVGVRAVRVSVALGRVRDAFRIAENLMVRYGAAGDAAVAMLGVEAWASVLEANYHPSTRGGVFGTDSPVALRRFWASLSGPDATDGPASLAPIVADVFLARGDRETAKQILEKAVVGGGNDFGALGAGKLSRALKLASALDPALQGTIIGQVEHSAANAELASVVAERLIVQGETAAAIVVIDNALAKAEGVDKRRLERLRRPLVDTQGIAGWLSEELRNDPGLDTAIFVLSRGESWAATDDTLVRTAIEQMKAAIGADSLRVVVAEAAMTMTFHGSDRSQLASSIAALDAAAMRSPYSASVLTTLAALFERQSPPQYDRSSKLLARAVDAEPGSASIYPQLVNALQQVGDFEGAESALEAYIEIVGEDLQSKRGVADFKARQGQLAEAAQIREQLVGRSKEVVDAVALARIRQRMGDIAAAEAILTEIGASLRTSIERPEGAEYSRELLVDREMALLYARDGRMEIARTTLTKAEQRLSGARLNEVRANIELAYGDVSAAMRIAEELVAKEGSASHELLLARTLLRTGELTKAREALTRSLKADPDNTDATTVAAALLVGDPAGRAMLERSLAAASVQRPDLAAAIALLDSVTTADGQISPTDASLARALAMTAEFSGSPLAWRVATHLHLLADRKDDAFRIAQRALTRLPGDASIGKLATESAIAAGRIDDASSCVLAWRKMATAEAFEVDLARATIDLLQRRPDRGFDLLKPFSRELLTRTGDSASVRMLIACAVQSGRWSEIRGDLDAIAPTRRGEIVGAWIECAQSIETSKAMLAIDSIVDFAKDDAISTAACIAAWTSLCRSGDGDGSADACAKASAALAKLGSEIVPTAILAADLASAQGDYATALTLYRQQYEPVLARFSSGATFNPSVVADRVASDPEVADALRRTPVAIVALNNAADTMMRVGGSGAEAAQLASIALAAMPNNPELIDTLVRALVSDRRFADAIVAASKNPDSVLAAIEIAEIELARKSTAEARRALARADARISASFTPSRAITERMQRLQAAISAAQIEANASTRRSEP